MTRDEMLGRLQPPTMPLDPGHWPPANIWWVLLTVSGIVFIGWLLWSRHQRLNRHFHHARRSLDQINSSFREHGNSAQLLQQLGYWLRQVARLADADGKITNLHGEDWLTYLDRDLQQAEFSQGPGTVFARQIYQTQAAFDSEAVLDLCYRWLDRSRGRLRG